MGVRAVSAACSVAVLLLAAAILRQHNPGRPLLDCQLQVRRHCAHRLWTLDFTAQHVTCASALAIQQVPCDTGLRAGKASGSNHQGVSHVQRHDVLAGGCHLPASDALFLSVSCLHRCAGPHVCAGFAAGALQSSLALSSSCTLLLSRARLLCAESALLSHVPDLGLHSGVRVLDRSRPAQHV